jgi:hypothetical protein
MDLAFAATIISYLYFATDTNILCAKKTSFSCGIIGGLSYLAHHYAFPFFLVHFPSMLLLRGYIDRDSEGLPLKKIFTSFGIGILGFLVIASIWVSVLSAKYGHFTISAKGSKTHAVVGPKDSDRRHPYFVGGLYKPRDDYSIHAFEDSSEIKFKTWSPFESTVYFKHQLKVIKENIIYILNHFVNKSPFFTYAFVIGTMTLIPLALLMNTLTDRKKFMYMWVIITFSFYCSGYLLIIARAPRRFYALMIVFILISFHFLDEARNGISNILSERRKKILSFYLFFIVILAFSLKPGLHLINTVRNIITIDYVNPYKEIAKQINSVQFPPPFAIIRSSQKPHTDLYLAYYLKKQLLGRPITRDADGITDEMGATGAKSLLVFDNHDVVETLKNDERYDLIISKKLKRDKRYLNAVNIKQDEIRNWDYEVTIFRLK